jgi:hypothetical protein
MTHPIARMRRMKRMRRRRFWGRFLRYHAADNVEAMVGMLTFDERSALAAFLPKPYPYSERVTATEVRSWGQSPAQSVAADIRELKRISDHEFTGGPHGCP